MPTPTDELLKRATETINKQAATIRDLRGEDTVGSAIEKSLSGETMHAAAAGAELVARGVREGTKNDYRKSVEKVGHALPAFGGENLGDRESFKKSKAENESGLRSNVFNRIPEVCR